MGRYANIELITEAEARQNPALLAAKMSWKRHFIVALFLLGWSIGFPAFLGINSLFNIGGSLFSLLFGVFIWIFCGLIVLTCALVGLIFLFSAFAAMRHSNWTLRATPEGLYLKLRNYGDYRLNATDPIVAFIPKREIRALHFMGQKTRMVTDPDIPEDKHLHKEEWLEIALYGTDLTLIDDALGKERTRKGPTWIKGVTANAKGADIKLMAETGIIRVDWNTRKTRLTPPLKEAETILDGIYLTEKEEAAEEAPLLTLSKEHQEDRLREMVRRGDAIGAAALVREIHGFSLTEAHQYLKSL
ncbi:hypothetical protein [Sneathiella sp. HT1-7]|uniref:hypothetical protein n=1 Tax=Sneathiella sp. HT1-7 TaxID=2887192 RepID=UPI001D1397B6|nr:hypothetical protein [Sneathiella sp. HT1-7]MCC3304984.1 hypothetical protein [Sneathiella sp. HT1-7]